LLVDLGLIQKVKFLKALELWEGGKLDLPVDRAVDLGEDLLLQETEQLVLIREFGVGGVLGLLLVDLPDAVKRECFQVRFDLVGFHGRRPPLLDSG
jgi:hypothetical protein